MKTPKIIKKVLDKTDFENKVKASELTNIYASLYQISKVENRNEAIIDLENHFNDKRRILEFEIYGEVIYP